MKIPKEFPLPENPLEWSLNLCTKEPRLMGTVMRKALQGVDEGESGMIYAARGNAPQEVREGLIEGVRSGAPVQLQIEPVFNVVSELKTFADSYFLPELAHHHPFGCSVGNAMFITGGGHLYNAHNDPGNNFLFQLQGTKIIRTWGPRKDFQEKILFDYNFRDNPERFAGPVEEVELRAGEVLYFHDGMMHEVRVPDEEQTVSIAIRADAHYSVLTLVREISAMVGQEKAYVLIPEVDYWDKFRTKLFSPDRFSKSLESEKGRCCMPSELKEELLRVIQSASKSLETCLEGNLNQWWQDFCARRNHCPTGVLPIPPENRVELLQAWEKERLAKNESSG